MPNYNLSAVISVKDNFTTTINKFNQGLKKSAFNSEMLEKGISRLGTTMGNTFKKAGSSALNFSKNLAIGLGAGATATGVFALKTASDMETYSNMLETSFKGNKEMAGDYFAWANKFANETPFSNKEVIESTVKLSMRGLDPKEVMGTVGDLASSMGKPLEQATEAVLDLMTGEIERLKEFGITKEMIVAKGAKLGFNDLVDANNSIKDTKKFMDVTFKLMQSMTKGSMEKQASTMKGLVSTFLGTGEFLLSRFAGIQERGGIRVGSAFDLIKNKLNEYVVKLDGAVKSGTVDKWIVKIDEFAQKGMKAFDDLMTSISNLTTEDVDKWIGSLKSGFESLEIVIKGVADTITFIKNNMETIKYVAGAMAGAKTGAMIGSVIPGVGTAVGAGAGAVLGLGATYFASDDDEETTKEEPKPIIRRNNERKRGIGERVAELEEKKGIKTFKPEPLSFEKNNSVEKVTNNNAKETKGIEPVIKKQTIQEKNNANKVAMPEFNPVQSKNISTQNTVRPVTINITGNNTFNNGTDINMFTRSLIDQFQIIA